MHMHACLVVERLTVHMQCQKVMSSRLYLSGLSLSYLNPYLHALQRWHYKGGQHQILLFFCTQMNVFSATHCLHTLASLSFRYCVVFPLPNQLHQHTLFLTRIVNRNVDVMLHLTDF